MSRKHREGKWIAIVAGLFLALALAYVAGVFPFSLIRPSITWVRPVKLHVGEVDYSDVWIVCGPVSGTAVSLSCPSQINSDVYFTGYSKPFMVVAADGGGGSSGGGSGSTPLGIAQYKYEETSDSWFWMVDLSDETSCTPNVGIAFRKISETQPDPVTGIMSVTFDYEILLTCDPWASGMIASPECGAKLKNSYFEILIDSPYYVHKVFIDGVEKTYYYDTSGNTKLIIPIPHDIPETNPTTPKVWIGPLPIWATNGKSFKHRMSIQVETGIVQETAETTITPSEEWRIGPTGLTTVEGWETPWTPPTVVYTVPVPTTTTEVVTDFRVVTETVYVTTQYGGQTVTVTSYIPGGTTVYDTATFTLPIVVTKKTTATLTAPTTITKVVTKTVTQPWKIDEKTLNIILGGLIFFGMIAAIIAPILWLAKTKSRGSRRGRRRR
ncbi:hypothetical protein DRO37_08800, partial [Candidatus Bathyarchaeota archaeon]